MRIYDDARRSDYDYRLVHRGEKPPLIVIYDLDLGGMSVTNNMEAVLGQIFVELGLRPGMEVPVIYRDSEGCYDAVNGGGSLDAVKVGTSLYGISFYPLAPGRCITDEEEARDVLKNHLYPFERIKEYFRPRNMTRAEFKAFLKETSSDL